MDRIKIKELSKQQLGGSIFSNNWLMGLLVCFLISAISGLASMLPFGSIIVTGPLEFTLVYILLKLIRTGEPININDIFEGFKTDFAGNFILGFMVMLFTVLWSMLFFIPGVIKSYSYSMAFYIKHDHPEYDWRQCIDESKRIMNGRKADLFVQDLSFLGWIIVGSCVCGIGVLWVMPYMELARANFYEAIKGNVQVTEQYTETYNA